MDSLLTSIGTFVVGQAAGEWVSAYLLVLFFKISAVVFIAFRIFRWFQKRAENEAARFRPESPKAPAEVAELVAKVAHQNLKIGSHQLDEPMKKLRIPRGDFLRFLDDLEMDHDLAVPDSAREMSTSISGIVAALCEGVDGRS